MLKTIQWCRNCLRIIDQKKLPSKLEYIGLKDYRTVGKAIRELSVRGAPAIGIATAFGIYLGIRDTNAKNFRPFL